MSNNIKKSIIISAALHATITIGFIGFLRAIEVPSKKATTLCMASFQKEDRQLQQPKKQQKSVRHETVHTIQTKPLSKKQTLNESIQKEPQNTEVADGEKEEEQTIANEKSTAPISTKHQTQEPKDESQEYIEANLAKIREAIIKHKRYPPLAVKMGCEGVCSISFRLHPSGSVDEIKVVKSSGFAALDRSSIQTIESAALEMPKPQRVVTIVIPIEYKLN